MLLGVLTITSSALGSGIDSVFTRLGLLVASEVSEVVEGLILLLVPSDVSEAFEIASGNLGHFHSPETNCKITASARAVPIAARACFIVRSRRQRQGD